MCDIDVCLLTHEYKTTYSGVGTYSRHLIDSLAKKGIKLTVLCPSEQVRRVNHSSKVNLIGVSGLGWDLTPDHWLSLSNSFANKLLELDKKGIRFDIIHFLDGRQALLYLYKSVPNSAAIGTVHDCYSAMSRAGIRFYVKYFPFDWKKRFFYQSVAKHLERYAYNRLDHIIVASKYVKDELSTNYYVSKDRIIILPFGINYDELRSKLGVLRVGLDNPTPVILFIGGNWQRKGVFLIMRAASYVIKKYPETQFVIIGRDPYMYKFKMIANNSGLLNNFKFIGHVDEDILLQYYARASILVLPSLYESFGIVLLEGMAAGLPVIGSRVGGAEEFIKHGSNGFLVNPYNHVELASLINLLLGDDELRCKLAREGERTASRFTIDNMVNKTLNFYSMIADI